jgi:hypothetical protein
MKKIVIAIALTTMMSGAAFAASNPSAPQPSSDGRGLNIPGISSTGTAIDRPDSNQAEEDAAMRRETAANMDSGDRMSSARTFR